MKRRHPITPRELGLILTALRQTKACVTDIAADHGRSWKTIKRIANANSVSIRGRA